MMPVACKICSKIFSCQSSVNRHLKNIHSDEGKKILPYDINCFNSKCLEENCDTSFRLIAELRHHLETFHKKKMEKDILQFPSMEEFERWFNQLGNTDYVKYVQHKRKDEKRNTYFNCHRSGNYTTKFENRQRAIKSAGTCKIGSNCTSQIVLSDPKTDGSGNYGDYNVTFYKNHYGHDLEIKHIRLSKESRLNVAAQLMSGVSATRVLDDCRSGFMKDKLSRSDILTRKDVNNIKVSFHLNLQDGVRHKNDVISVDLLVKQCREIGDEILLYKKQGENIEDYPMLKTDDFCLVYMNKAQENLLKEFGSFIVAIDSTHGLNMYDFELTTLMIIDEFGEGFPVACLFSNRKDTLIYEVFFDCVKSKCGKIVPKVFMSDITSVYYNAWIGVMGGEIAHRLYCSWHIDRAWRSNLNKINNVSLRKDIYKTLKVLQNTLNAADFEIKLGAALKYFLNDPDTRNFGIYFSEYYVNNSKMWAYCYRKSAGINTNMVLESMHKTIKYFYLEGKVVKRLDRGITAVLKYIRDKIVSRVIKITKGVNNSHIQNIHNRHRIALTMNSEIIPIEDNVWTIKTNTSEYVVTQKDLCKMPKCHLRCSFCQICIHGFECTCVDFYIKTTICKHIHYIVINSNIVKDNLPSCSMNEVSNVSAELSTLAKSSSCKNPDEVKEKIKDELNKVHFNLNCYNENESDPLLPHILKMTQNTNSLLCNMGQSDKKSFFGSEGTISGEPSNKKLKKQLSFFSTKKKRVTKGNSTIVKPSSAESSAINCQLDIINEHNYF